MAFRAVLYLCIGLSIAEKCTLPDEHSVKRNDGSGGFTDVVKRLDYSYYVTAYSGGLGFDILLESAKKDNIKIPTGASIAEKCTLPNEHSVKRNDGSGGFTDAVEGFDNSYHVTVYSDDMNFDMMLQSAKADNIKIPKDRADIIKLISYLICRQHEYAAKHPLTISIGYPRKTGYRKYE